MREVRRDIARMKTELRNREVTAMDEVALAKDLKLEHEEQRVNNIMSERNLRKTRVGVVTSNKMEKSITVSVERRLPHPIYGKFVKTYQQIHGS